MDRRRWGGRFVGHARGSVHETLVRFRVIRAVLAVSLVLVPLLTLGGVTPAPQAMVQIEGPPGIDLTLNGLVNQPQTHPMWGDIAIGPNQDKMMGRCGCLLSALSTTITFLLGDGSTGSTPWFPVQLNSLVIDPWDENIEHDSKTKKGPLEPKLSFSPIYIDSFLRHGNGFQPVVPNWGYKPSTGCGVKINLHALERLAMPAMVVAPDGKQVSMTPSGVRVQWHWGWGSNVREIVDRNLRNEQPTIVGLKDPTTGEQHAHVIAGWDSAAKRYLVLDPADRSWEFFAHWPDFAGSTNPDADYARWESMITGIFDVQKVHVEELSKLTLRIQDDPAPFELIATGPDGSRSGFDMESGRHLYQDPAVNYYPQPLDSDLLGELAAPSPEKLMTIRDPRPGVYRFLATATGTGRLVLRFDLVDGSDITDLGIVEQDIVAGQAVKIEVVSTGTGISSVSQVSNFRPEARTRDVAGRAGSSMLFDARRSFDPDGTIVSYRWDFGDGSPEVTTTSPTTYYRYAADGNYTVTLTAIDDQGAEASTTVGAFVGERPPGRVEILSVSSGGETGKNHSYRPSISGSGQFVAFHSLAPNLVSNDTNSAFDVFVRDRQTGLTERVSISSSGAEANGVSEYASISEDGRHVAFASNASNLVQGDSNVTRDIFVHDRDTGETVRVSVSSTDGQGNGYSDFPALSPDGRFVAFMSKATNLDTNVTGTAYNQVFVHDRDTDGNGIFDEPGGITTRQASISSAGEPGNDHSQFRGGPSISGDGRFVVFESLASNLVPDDENGERDVFIHDVQNGTTERISDADNGSEGDMGSGYETAMTPDARFVVFSSSSSNLLAGTTTNRHHVYVRDRLQNTLELVSVSSDGVPGDSVSGMISSLNAATSVAISADGRFVAFPSYASNLVPNDTNNQPDIFVRDRLRGTTTRASVDTNRRQSVVPLVDPSLSSDGRFVAFGQPTWWTSPIDTGWTSPADTNRQKDVFSRDLGSPDPKQPIADAGGPYLGWATSPGRETSIWFDARTSVAQNGLPLRAEWDFGDGSPLVATDSLTTYHSYAEPGVYTLTVTVRDDLVESRSITTTVEVLPAPPEDRLTVAPSCVSIGAEVHISGFHAEGNKHLLTNGWNFAKGPMLVEPVQVELPWSSGELVSLIPGLPDLKFETVVTTPDGLASGSYEIAIPNGPSSDFAAPCSSGNQLPLADAGGPYEATTGIGIQLDGSGSSDPENAPLAYLWDFGDGNAGEGSTPHHTYEYPGTYLVALVVNDGQSNSELTFRPRSYALVIVTGDPPEVADQIPPVITIVTPVSDAALDVGTRLEFSAEDDESGLASLTAWLSSEDGTASHAITSGDVVDRAGFYTLDVEAVDNAGNHASESRSFVVYDPSGGKVTGGGWIESPAGACAFHDACAGATGRATIGFNVQYQKRNNARPSGQTQFNFVAGKLDFHSASYDWLVTSGTKAQYSGTGTINGAGDYGFLITALDVKVKGSDQSDAIRVMIWNRETGDVVYDTQPGAASNANPVTILQGGSLTTHK